MSKDRSDFAVMNRMIDHIRLLIAVDDEQITVKKKLDVQAVLKEFQALLAVPEEQQERRRVKGYYDLLCRELGEHGDVDALLKSLKNYISYI
jgi:hypothetical protein